MYLFRRLPFPSLVFALFLSTAYILQPLGSVGYLIQYLLLLTVLAFSRRLSLAFGFTALAIFLFFSSFLSDEFFLVRILPSLGFFFCGPLKPNIVNFFSGSPKFVRFELLFQSLSFIIAASSQFLLKGLYASQNFLSILLLLLLAFYILVGNYTYPTRKVICILGLTCFFVFGNRSAILCLAVFPLPLLISIFLCAILLILMFTSYAPGLTSAIPFLPEDESPLWSRDTRIIYFFDAITTDFYLFDFDQQPKLLVTPTTSKGFPDFHNSYITILYRDRIFGLIKILFFALLCFFQPLGFAFYLSTRIFLDTSLLGSIYDTLIWPTLVGSVFQSKFISSNSP